MTKKIKKNDQRFENSVKPYYHPSEDGCFLVYSPTKKISPKTEFVAYQVDQVKAKFGLNLICGDLTKSTNEAFKYISV